jgi:leucyl-tRNA synthetase
MTIGLKFDHSRVEKYWQKEWSKANTYTPSLDNHKNKFFNLWMFPYPSAEGLHAGHAFASTGSDVIGRFMRMTGVNLFQPMVGYDSFGIHAENYALKINEHPMTMLKRVTKHYGEQMRTLGHGYDWTRSVTTSDLNYYSWTEWLFLQIFKAGLAYRKKALVNWCPSCKTVLADEQVMTPAQAGKEAKTYDGKPMHTSEQVLVCERCGTVVEKRELEQWFFRITDYAEKLLVNLGKIDWPEKIKIAQTNWIGKKEGINITYPIKGSTDTITVWTSRPDTNFGATFIVISPENPIVGKLLKPEYKEGAQLYIDKSKQKSKEERISEGREKTGVFTGSYAVNQLNNKDMPIYIADFVLMEVGTGAVVGVPGHDKRDYEFARQFNLQIERVVVGRDGDASEIKDIKQVQEEDGQMINSEFLNGLNIHDATQKMMDYLEKQGWGKRITNYHLRDWLISRQRYWGTPIPMIYCQKCASLGQSWFNRGSKSKTLIHKDQSDWESAGWWPDDNLPVKLPFIPDYQPEGTGQGPLAKHPEFYEVSCPNCGSTARRETDVSDTFLDSSWYFLRYPSVNSKNADKFPFDKTITRNWLPVDLYFGGAEHSVLHLMYARFVTMLLNSLGFLNFDEPFPRFFAHGLMIKDGAKMSKSRGNIVNPDVYIEKYGADTLRLYLMFMGPMDGYPDFRDTGIEGMRRFVEKVWQLFQTSNSSPKRLATQDNKETIVKMHQTIKKVSEDIQNFKYNTSISAIMEYISVIKEKGATQKNLEVLALLLAPFAPHLAEEIWVNILGQKFSVHNSTWPKYDPKALKENEVSIPVQVNGKLRATVQFNSQESKQKEIVLSTAKANGKVKVWLEGKEIKNEVFVPGKILNIVTNN